MTVNAPPASSSSGGVAAGTPLKRLGALIGVALVAALMTGPPGDSPTPLAGVKGSIFHPRVLAFLGAAVALWALVSVPPVLLEQWRNNVKTAGVDGARGSFFGLRLLAYLVDGLLSAAWVAVGVLVLVYVSRGVQAQVGGGAGDALSVLVLVVGDIAVLLLPNVVLSLAEARTGQTPGRVLTGLRLVRVEEGAVVGFWRAFLRRAAQSLSAAPLFLGFFWMLRAPSAQTWHDGLSGTRVVADSAASSPGSIFTTLRVKQSRPVTYGSYLVLLLVAIFFVPGLSPAAQQSSVTDVGIYALLALGLNVVIGYAGLLDLGYIAFYAIGAYATAFFTSASALPVHSSVLFNPFAVFPIALVIASFAGLLLGGPTLRLRGDYLAIVTLGFGEIVQTVANNADGITNGSRGAFGVPNMSIHLGPINYDWGIRPLPYYYLLVGLIVLVMLAFSALERSRIGRGLAAIREDEVAAEATGVPTLRYKLLAFAIGASTSGIAGVIFATKQFFNPQTFSLQASLLVLTVVIFGGMGSLFGVVLGSVVIQGTFFYLRDVVPPNDRYIYFGALIIVMMVFRPQGLLPSRRRSQEIALVEGGGATPEMLAAGPVHE